MHACVRACVRIQPALTFTNNAATESAALFPGRHMTVETECRQRGADNELTKCHAAISGQRNKVHLQQKNERRAGKEAEGE